VFEITLIDRFPCHGFIISQQKYNSCLNTPFLTRWNDSKTATATGLISFQATTLKPVLKTYKVEPS
jgi:hypothetical protein